MAKLGARGREALVRLVKTTETPDGELTVRTRMTVAFMSDGTLLRKRDVWFRATGHHTYGWKVHQKYTVAKLDQHVAKLIDDGYTKE